MTQLTFKNITRFIFLILFQVWILNNVRLGGYINPYFYVYFVLLLPFSTPRWLLLVSSFMLGFIMDLLMNTPGVNAFATTLMAFARPFVISLISTGTEYEIGERPSIKNQDMTWFVYYCVILILIHHTALFFIEVFRVGEFFATFFRVILSSAFTFLLVMISEYAFYSRQK